MASDYEVISLLNKHISNWPIIKQKIIKELFISYMEVSPKWAESFNAESFSNAYDIRPYAIFLEVIESFTDVNDNSDFSWKINNLSGKEDVFHRYSSKLESAVETYIQYRSEASSKTLELWLLRALAYEEIDAFKEKNKAILTRYKSPGIRLILNIIFLLILISCAFFIGAQYSAAVGIFSLLSVGYLHTIFHNHEESEFKKTMHTYDVMGRFYNKLTSHDFVSPSEIERYANEAQQSGALWPYGMYDIITMAKDRSPMRWE